MPRVKKVKPPKVPLTPEQKKLRRLARAEDRKRNPPRERQLDPNFDWSSVPRFDGRPHLYIYRCSCKCPRASENPPNSLCGEGAYFKFKNKKGNLRWMCSFKKRSQRDEMLREGKAATGRKFKKEPNREPSG